MSKMLAGLGGNAGAVVAGGGMVVVLALGAYIGFGSDLSPEADPVVATSAQTPQTETANGAPKDDDVAAASPEGAPEPQRPSFDELRRETDGTTIIAGRAEPLSDVKIIVDGDEVATAKADSQGGFAAITVLPPKDTAQVVSLSSQGAEAGDEETASLDEIILAPAKTPIVIAPATPEQSDPARQGTTVAVAEPSTNVVVADVAEDVAAVRLEVENVPDTKATGSELATNKNNEPNPKPARIAVLKSDETGVSLLNPVQPEAMTSVALDTIGYSDLGDVQLTGRAQPDTVKVRVYLDNRSIISLPVDAKGRWRGDLPDVDEGVYTLRVDEVSVDGEVSSRVETPFKRESVEVLAEASASDGPIKSITVQTGATLWAIARDRYGDGTLYLRVFDANAKSIRDPDLIYPGQVFDLPN